MHQLLEAKRKRDVERIGTALSKLHRTIPSRKTSGKRSMTDTPPRGGQYPRSVAHYFFACIEKMHTRFDKRSSPPRTANSACHLSPRELTVLRWMKEGKTNWEIAHILGLSERTIRFHVGSIFEKLDVTSRTQAVARALGVGLIAS
jgi:DNA-binding CsgD family transcriptional regulator